MSQVQATLDHLFRRESGRIVAYLTRFLGTDNLDLAETVIQEALLKAVQIWPLQGIPDNPGGWILKVAKNLAIDQLRQKKYYSYDSEIELDSLVSADVEHTFENEITDDQLKLMFICCHADLSREARLALTLKTVCGFSVKEIAKAFLSKEETIAQRIVRAKQKITEEKLRFEMPTNLDSRIQSVLEVLYLLFNEGYSATEGDALIRKDLCDEAIYRTTFLASHPVGKSPKTFALLSLMHLQASRFNSRVDANGELLLLEEQDRTLWDKEHVRVGLAYLELSAEGDDISEYHLQAGIASCHAIAQSFAETDWQQIVQYYDMLLLQADSPIVALNRCVAIAMIHGPEAGLREIELIRDLPPLRAYYLLPATIAELHRRCGNLLEAKIHYEKALDLAGTEPEKKLLVKRISKCVEESLWIKK